MFCVHAERADLLSDFHGGFDGASEHVGELRGWLARDV